jgi:hypothetical protein
MKNILAHISSLGKPNISRWKPATEGARFKKNASLLITTAFYKNNLQVFNLTELYSCLV